LSLPLLPGELDTAIASWLQESSTGARLREKSDQLTAKYRAGQNSTHIDLTAYLTTRMPATFAAIVRVLSEIAQVLPHFAPQSVLDVGAGPGTASWAALRTWPEIDKLTLVEADHRFATLAQNLAKLANVPALSNATVTLAPMAQASIEAELVIAAYVFAELAEKNASDAALKLWAQTQKLLVVIEPGTPRGFARIKAARDALLAAGANMIGPCTHANTCPIRSGDWCHFAVRLARSREHMHAKQATVPFEDENFSWIAVAREAAALPQARIIKPPTATKYQLALPLCSAKGLTTSVIATRNKAAYKSNKKRAWGDAIQGVEE
jgi:ribosomal protein RSM22 (predicted rRNA methylase)